jgi:hypothetical protein
MNHIALDQREEAVKQFILSLPLEPQGSVLELEGRAVAWVVAPVVSTANGEEPWTEARNQWRCELIDRKYAGEITPAEAVELAHLQEQMLRYRQRMAPLPLETARCLHQELLDKVARFAWSSRSKR